MGKFVTIDKTAGGVAYWKDFDARTPIRKAPRMLTKSVSEVAWSAVYSLAREMTSAGKAPDVDSAVQQLRLGNHPTYQTYLAVSESGSPHPTTPAADIGKVVKAAQAASVAKRAAVQTEMSKRATALVRGGQAANELEAMAAVFKADPQLYEEYRKSSYASGPLPEAPAPARAVVPDLPAYTLAKQMALAMRHDDPWNQYSGLSEVQMLEKVWQQNPALYQAYRQEHRSRARAREGKGIS